MGLLLIASPWLFGFNRGGAETWVFVILGVGALVYSLMTRYELGALKVIPFKVHLMLDIASGILLAASPWLFSFSELVYLPHLIFGIVEILSPLMTKPYVDHPATVQQTHPNTH